MVDCRDDDKGDVFYNVANDIYLPFGKDELFEHIRKTRRIVEVYANFSHKAAAKEVGLHFKIE